MLTKIQKVPIKLLLTLVFILLASIVFLLRLRQKPESVEAGWWNDSWHYRQPISIGWTGTALTDFQISVDIGTSALVNDGKMQTDCDDIRFTDQFGNLIPHWIEENNPGCNAATDTKIWLKPSSIPQNGTTIYLYYGNSSASNSESGIDVFNFFDGFDGSSLDSKWTALETGYTNVSNSFLEIDRTSLNTQIAAVYPSLSESIIEFKGIQLMESYSYRNRFYFGTFNGSTFSQSNPGGGDYGFFQDGSGTDETEIYHNGWRNISLNTTDLFSIKHVLRGSVVDSYYQNQSAGTTIYSATGLTPTISNSSINSIELAVTEATTSHFKIDTVLVRKYSSSEPTFSLLGSEETGTGPIAYWDFNEGAGSTAHDLISNNHGSFSTGDSSPTWTSGVINKAASFDGNDKITIANPPIDDFDTGPMSVSIWVNTLTSSSFTTLIDNKTAGTNNAGFNIQLDSSWRPYFRIANGSSQYSTTTDIAINDGQWHHIVGVLERTGGANDITRIYVDGILKKTGSLTSGWDITSTQALLLGHYGSSGYLTGAIDEVKIFDYALTPDQIKVEYNRGAGVAIGVSQKASDVGSSNLVAEWKFEEGIGTTAFDTSGNNNNNLITGASWTSGKIGKALSFDGNDYLRSSNNIGIGGSSPRTISFWAKANSTSNQGMVGWGTASSNLWSIAIIYSGNWYFNAYGANDWNTGVAANTNWNHHTITYDSTNVTWYVNGTSIGSVARALNTTDSVVEIGRRIGTNDMYFSGSIDHVKIFNTALTPDQIAFEYNQAGPIAHWSFNEGSGSTAHDSIGNNHGTFGTGDSAPSWTNNGKIGKAISYDGYDRINVGDDKDPNFVSISAWVNINNYNTSGNYTRIISNTFSYELIMYGFSGGEGRLEWKTYTTSGEVNATTPISKAMSLHNWYHLIATYDGSKSKIYINGILSGESDQTGNLVNQNNFSIGGQSTGAWGFDGLIDEVKVFNYALTPEEVAIEYNRGSALVLGSGTNDSDVGTTNLVAEWKFEEGVGTTAYDTSGNSNHLSLSSTSWTTGKYGKALDFDGSASGTSVTDTPSISLTNTGTIQAWVYSNRQYPSDDGTTKFREIINKWTGGSCSGSDEGYFLDWYGTDTTATLRGYICNGTTSQGITKSSTTFTPNTWNLITYVWNGTSHQLYINGSSIGSTVAQTINNQDDSGTLKIGSGFGSWDGKIDHVKIWNTALTPAQIAWEYNQGAPVAHWRLDEKSGSIAYDSSENSNHGTLTNFPTDNSQWTSGKLNNALTFDGTNDYVSIAHTSSYNFNANNSFTLTAWINANSYLDNLAASRGGTVFSKKWDDESGYHLQFTDTGDGGLRFIMATGSTMAIVDSTTTLDLSKWYFVTIVVDRQQNESVFYINGSKDSAPYDISTIGSLENSRAGYIGRRSWYIGTIKGVFNGLIDDVRVYNYALTPDQVKNLYNGGASVKFN